MLLLYKSSAWDSLGSSLLTRLSLVSPLKLFGLPALKQKPLLNTLFQHAFTLQATSVAVTLDLLELLTKYGDNVMTCQAYYATLLACYQFSVNRCSFNEAFELEEKLHLYLQMSRSNVETGQVWLMKVKAMIAQKEYEEAHNSI